MTYAVSGSFPDTVIIAVVQVMPSKKDSDATSGVKLLRLFRKLMLQGGKHYQTDLSKYLHCSTQTVMRLVSQIESEIGASLETGLENRRRWYQIRSIARSRLGLEFEEIRYLSVCRDLAAPLLPEQVMARVDESIFNLAVLMADQDYAEREKVQKNRFVFFSKGRIDYTPHHGHIECLLQAIDSRCVCLVRYKAAGKTESKEHRFAPSRIVSMSNSLYVLGAGVTDDFLDMRHLMNLAIHRILDVVLTDNQIHFEMPEVDTGAFGLPWHEPRMFRVRFAPGRAAEYVRERIWAEDQCVEDMPDGGLVLTVTTRSEPEVLAWVRSFGDAAQILDCPQSSACPLVDVDKGDQSNTA